MFNIQCSMFNVWLGRWLITNTDLKYPTSNWERRIIIEFGVLNQDSLISIGVQHSLIVVQYSISNLSLVTQVEQVVPGFVYL